MSYPGSAELESKVQQRILTAFGEAVRLYRDGLVEESLTILRSVLEVDPRFVPAQRLSTALTTGGEVDLAELYGELAGAEPVDVEEKLAQAKEAIVRRDFQGALELAQSVLRELPGQPEARQISLEVQASIKATEEVQRYIHQADRAIHDGRLSEANDFFVAARKLDPDNPALGKLGLRLKAAAGAEVGRGGPPSVEALAAAPEEAGEAEWAFASDGASQGMPEAPAEAAPAATPDESSPILRGPLPAPPPEPEAMASAPPAPAPQAPPPTPEATVPVQVRGGEAEPKPGGFAFDDGAADGAPAFDRPANEGSAAAVVRGPAAGDTKARVSALLEEGKVALGRDDYQAAIDAFSRVLLLEPDHAEAEELVGQARQRVGEQERVVEQRFHEAREAFEQGRRDEARAHCQKVLELHPQHLEAHDLLARLETPAAPPPPPPPPDSEEDLFRDDFVPAKEPTVAPTVRVELPKKEAKPAGITLPSLDVLRKLPLPIVGAVAAGLILIVVVAMMLLRGSVFSGGGDAITDTVAEAERLAGAGRLQEAVTLLRSLELEGEQQHQVNLKILEYQRRLKARPTPPKVEDAATIRAAIAAGKRLEALSLVRDGLEKVPGDPELIELQEEITGYSAALPGLLDAATARQWQLAKQHAAQVRAEHRDDPEAQRAWEAAIFNEALELLRTYQVAGAHSLLDELARVGPEPEVERLRELAASYLSRPVDPRYEIFLRSIAERSVLGE